MAAVSDQSAMTKLTRASFSYDQRFSSFAGLATALNFECEACTADARYCDLPSYDGRCALKIIASQIRKSRAHTPSRTSHTPLAHRIRLPFIVQTPRFPLGGVFRLGLDRARSMGSTVIVFALFRGSLEAVFLFFRSPEGPRNYP